VKRHEGFVEIAKKGGVEFLLLGDSITDGWRGKGKAATRSTSSRSSPRTSASAGPDPARALAPPERRAGRHHAEALHADDRDEQRQGLREDVAAGITAIVKEIQKKSPSTKILLLGIFPRGEKPYPGREKNDKVNTIVAKLDDGGKTVKYLDIGAKFLAEDKSLTKEIMPDFLHLSEKGYGIWAEAVLPTVKEMLAK
jgi:lysophospholipase L1-like esterase